MKLYFTKPMTIPNSASSIKAVVAFLFMLVLSSCATKELVKPTVEVYDFPVGQTPSGGASRPNANNINTANDANTAVKTNQKPTIKKTNGAPIEPVSGVVDIKNWPKVQRLSVSDDNRQQMIKDLGAAAGQRATTAQSTPVPSPKVDTEEASKPSSVPTNADNKSINKEGVIFSWPHKGSIIKGFSKTAGSKGIQIAGTVGQTIYAAADGQVTYTGSGLRGYGKLVVIKHANNFLTVYAHNSKILAREGSKVSRGDAIAELGDSEAESPMLFFQLRKGKNLLDPMDYLPKD